MRVVARLQFQPVARPVAKLVQRALEVAAGEYDSAGGELTFRIRRKYEVVNLLRGDAA
jgi:hypothetical protein